MKGIKSQGHVEVILSFVIFIGFLLFVLVFLNPFTRTEEPSYIMDNAQKAIINNITSKVGKLSVITNGSSCYNFTASDYNGKYKEIDEGSGKFTIYFNEIFNNNAPKKGTCTLKYTLGVYSEQEMVIYNKIIALKADYDNNYATLKNSLGITNDFLFNVKDLAGTDIAVLSVSRNIPSGIDVESREIPIRVINNNGIIQELILNIKVW